MIKLIFKEQKKNVLNYDDGALKRNHFLAFIDSTFVIIGNGIILLIKSSIYFSLKMNRRSFVQRRKCS